MSVERDENYVPRTRRNYGLPSESTATPADYHEIFEETPIYMLLRMLLMQAVGWQYYLCSNVMGSPMYPPGTNVSWIYGEFIWPSNFFISIFNLLHLFLNLTSGTELSPPISVSVSCRSSSIFGPKKFASLIWSCSTLSHTWYALTQSLKVHFISFLPVCESLDRHVNLPPSLRSQNSSLPQQGVEFPPWSCFYRWPTAFGVGRAFLSALCFSWPCKWRFVFFITPSHSMQIAHHLFSSIPFCNAVIRFMRQSPDFSVDNQPYVTEAIKKVLKDNCNYNSTVRSDISRCSLDL
jgi:omega-6 fatty acid desaturase (delta-12 desaturase)